MKAGDAVIAQLDAQVDGEGAISFALGVRA